MLAVFRDFIRFLARAAYASNYMVDITCFKLLLLLLLLLRLRLNVTILKISIVVKIQLKYNINLF
jgi:hypothetical protein